MRDQNDPGIVRTKPNLSDGPWRPWAIAEDRLRELLHLLGIERAPRRTWSPAPRDVQLAAGGISGDEGERGRIYRRELVEAEPVLVEIVHQARAIASNEDRSALATCWNDAISERGWQMLPTACEVCGVPIFLRQPERHGNGNHDAPIVCSDTCGKKRRDRKAAQKYRMKQKLKDAT